ncbi:MAG: RadC family protein [Salinibacter sp.]
MTGTYVMTLFEDYSISKARVRLREEKRFYGPEERKQVTSPDEVCALLWEEIYRKAACEIFVVCLLNTANVVQTVFKTSEGGLSGTVVNPRDVCQPALLDNASAVICAHNHPSGNPEPSREDLKMTQALQEAGEILDTPLHDHLIITGESGYTSLAERDVL